MVRHTLNERERKDSTILNSKLMSTIINIVLPILQTFYACAMCMCMCQWETVQMKIIFLITLMTTTSSVVTIYFLLNTRCVLGVHYHSFISVFLLQKLIKIAFYCGNVTTTIYRVVSLMENFKSRKIASSVLIAKRKFKDGYIMDNMPTTILSK